MDYPPEKDIRMFQIAYRRILETVTKIDTLIMWKLERSSFEFQRRTGINNFRVAQFLMCMNFCFASFLELQSGNELGFSLLIVISIGAGYFSFGILAAIMEKTYASDRMLGYPNFVPGVLLLAKCFFVFDLMISMLQGSFDTVVRVLIFLFIFYLMSFRPIHESERLVLDAETK